MSQLQISNATQRNRYPDTYDFLQKLIPNPKSVLSFGCSTGEEVMDLTDRFPYSQVFGVESNLMVLRSAFKTVEETTAILSDVILPNGDGYDLVLAMSVLCRWPEPLGKALLSYESFEEGLAHLSRSVAPGGILVINNASYNPNEYLSDNGFQIVDNNLDAGFVTIRDSSGNFYEGKRHCIWRKA